MAEKYYENDAVRMTSCTSGDKIKKIPKDGIKIKTEFGEFEFFPSQEIVDPVGDPIIYIKFNHKEKLILYHTTNHPERRRALEKFKASVMMANTMSRGKLGNYIVRDIMDYVEEIEKITEDFKSGKIKFKDGIHPEMKDVFE